MARLSGLRVTRYGLLVTGYRVTQQNVRGMRESCQCEVGRIIDVPVMQSRTHSLVAMGSDAIHMRPFDSFDKSVTYQFGEQPRDPCAAAVFGLFVSGWGLIQGLADMVIAKARQEMFSAQGGSR